jgi:multisubunit Na+/H+ antiporter MnhC subunit
MIGVTLAAMVGVLFACGVYLMLRRDPVKLILGVSLFTYGINLLMFGSGKLLRGVPPVIVDKELFVGDISDFVDPLPQALILTAIVIGFGITAFFVVLLNLRNTLVDTVRDHATGYQQEVAGDPFAATGHYLSDLDEDPADYEWLEYDPHFDPLKPQESIRRQAEESDSLKENA